MIVRHNEFVLTLTLARSCHADELAGWCGRRGAWAAGVIDAVDGSPDWTQLWDSDYPSEQEAEDYAAGFAMGQGLLAGVAPPCVAPAGVLLAA